MRQLQRRPPGSSRQTYQISAAGATGKMRGFRTVSTPSSNCDFFVATAAARGV